MDLNQSQQSQSKQPAQPAVNPIPPQKNYFLLGILIAVAALLGSGATYLALQSKQPEPTPIAQTTPTPTPPPAGGPTANWKMYENTKYNYSLTYPPFVSLKEIDHQTYLNDKKFRDGSLDTNATYVILETNKGSLAIIPNPGGRGVNPLASKEIVIDGKRTEKIYESDTSGFITQVPNPNKTLWMQFNFYLPENLKERQEFDKLIDQILSTFKFTQ